MNDAPRLALHRHAELKRRRHGDVLVLPEQAIRLEGSGAEIAALCDGARTRADVVRVLDARYADTPDLASTVDAFVDQLIGMGGLEERAAVDARPRAPGDAERVDAAPRSMPDADAAIDVDHVPLNLIAELTYRCPLMCPYCSNPMDFRERREDLSADEWARVFAEAAALGAVHVGLTGGEPSARRDLEAIVEAAIAADLYPHLVTAGLPLTPDGLERLAALGLRSVQVSFQDATAVGSDRIAGTRSFAQKRAISEATRTLGLALTLNCVLHRENLDHTADIIALAEELGADRLELANTQYHGWALENRAWLMPRPEQLARAQAAVRDAETRAREREDRTRMLFVLPDYFSDRPKPCMGGWGRQAMVVDPTGLVLPCHDASTIPSLEFWSAKDRDLRTCWSDAPGMQAYRGFDWMPEPCRGCPDRERDFGGCRCQAFRLLGDAGLTDPACERSPHHDLIVAARSGDGAPSERNAATLETKSEAATFRARR